MPVVICVDQLIVSTMTKIYERETMADTTQQATPGNPTFHRLWPTLFMTVTLPGHEQANAMLSGLVLEKNVEQEQMTTNYLEYNLMEDENPAVLWLRQCFEKAVQDYAQEAGITYALDWTIQAWPNVNFRGDYHNLHNHPHSWLSGTYYLNVPDQSAADTFRSDLNPGAISFFDPRPQANMGAVRSDGQFDPEFRRLPEPGELFLWPAFLHHLVHPNLVDVPRLSISFNVVLRNKANYL